MSVKYILYTVLLYLFQSSTTHASNVNIGVLAYKGKAETLSRWQPMADYLGKKIPKHQFHIVPLALNQFEHEINKEKLDFVLTNPSHYVRLEVAFGATRMATFLSKQNDLTLSQYSSVLIVKSDSAIESFKDLKGKKFAAVNRRAFGGFQLAQYELIKHGINPLTDMEMRWMGFPHHDIVFSVINGAADVATVRSGIVEEMIERGEIKLQDIKVIGRKTKPFFPFMRSFDLYPEWPIAKLPDTDHELARDVVVALLLFSKLNQNATKSNGGWTIPLNYSSVHQVLKALEAEPYLPQQTEWKDIWLEYKPWIIIASFLVIFSIIFMLRFIQINRNLNNAKNRLKIHKIELEDTVDLRTKALKKEIKGHLLADETIDKGCQVLQEIHSVLVRSDLQREQRIRSMIDCLRNYLGFEYALLSRVEQDKFITCAMSPDQVDRNGLLSLHGVQDSTKTKNVVCHEDTKEWKYYVACPIYSDNILLCVLEFATSNNDEKDVQLLTTLSRKILYLIAQWLGSESRIMQHEKIEQVKLLDISDRLKDLSVREKEVIGLLVLGESNKSMAKQLNLSVKTIETHRSNALKKTHAKSSAELIQIAVQSGEFMNKDLEHIKT